MIDTVLFDLDGTLLHFSQKDFIDAYFSKLGVVFTKLGMDAELSIKAVWTGTKAMLQNDGSRTNSESFWAAFAAFTGLSDEKLKAVEAACDKFYTTEFDTIKALMSPNSVSARLVRSLAAKGFTLVLASNPLFPECAFTTRLSWIGLEPRDFSLVTHYSNSTFCKPNPGYYREIFGKIGRKPEQCLMAGNNPAEDMVAGALGAKTFLVTDCLENEGNADIAAFRHGTLAELERMLVND
jgi:FMN phosphatase YigB (HAD superfamily)